MKKINDVSSVVDFLEEDLALIVTEWILVFSGANEMTLKEICGSIGGVCDYDLEAGSVTYKVYEPQVCNIALQRKYMEIVNSIGNSLAETFRVKFEYANLSSKTTIK